MNGFKAHLQNSGTYSSGTDDLSLANGAYRLILWKTLSITKGWSLDAASGALYAKTPGLKLFRGHLWVTAGLTVGGVNTIKITLGGNPANLTTQDGGDVDAAIHYASGAAVDGSNFVKGTGGESGRAGMIFGGVANMAAGDFVRVWYWGTGAGSITVNGHLAHSMFEAIDNGGGYSY